MTDTGPALRAVEATRPEQGTDAANERALEALPMQQTPPVMPGARGPLTRPTERPNEPITAGLSTGPGPGPSQSLTDLDRIKAIHRAHPSAGLRRMIEHLQQIGL